jgi:hypothetical protein
MFPDGAILRIDTQHADASIQDKPECIRLSELLGPKQGLSFAVLSAFAVDPSWLYEFFDRDTPVVLVADSNICGAEASDVCVNNPFFIILRLPPHLLRFLPSLASYLSPSFYILN